MKLYRKSYCIYTVKDFIGYLFSPCHCCLTCLRLVRPKSNSKWPSDINTELTIPENILGFYSNFENFRKNKASPLETPHNRVTPFINFKANQDPWKFYEIFSWSRPENSTLFFSQKNTFIAIENTYLSEWSFLKSKISVCPWKKFQS